MFSNHNLLLITITITSNSINKNTNNSIVGNTYLYFLQNKNIPQYDELIEFVASFGPLSTKSSNQQNAFG